MSRQYGVSLTELMISLCLSSLLMMALIQTWLTGNRHYNQSQIILEQGFELQLVNELIRDSVRLAGFMPCIGITHLIAKDRRDKPHPLVAVDLISDNSHSITLARMGEDFVNVLQQIGPSRLLVDKGHSFNIGNAIVIADCYHAEVHVVADSKKTPRGWIVSLEKPLDFDYILPFHLGEWLEERFFIQKNREGKSALYYGTNHTEELTDQVNDLSIQLQSSLVRITLSLAKGGNVVLNTQVRAP